MQLIKAEDEGGLSSTATVNIRVSDINDKNPEFVDLPYEFSVKEGKPTSVKNLVITTVELPTVVNELRTLPLQDEN